MVIEKENQKGERNGLITTVLVHALMLILCLFFGFNYMTPPKGDVSIGFEALGTNDAGSTNELATHEKLSDTPEETQETPEQSQDNPVEENYNTQDESLVEVTKNTSATKKNSSENSKELANSKTTEKQREVDESLKNLGGLLQGNDNPGGKGDGGKEGNEGGEKGVPNEEGDGGSGKDGMFDFGGRKALKPGNLKHDCGVRATADVRVTVDRSGNVINAVMVGGTNINDCIERKAIAAAKGTKYSANPDGPKFQEGKISLSFHVN